MEPLEPEKTIEEYEKQFSKESERTHFQGLRTFVSGATRSPLDDKLQYSGFISPIVLKRYAEYMHRHRLQSDGELRDADNWQKGIPDDSAFDSMLRHVMDIWLYGRDFGAEATEEKLESLCAIIFNASVLIFNQEKKNATSTKRTNRRCCKCGMTLDVSSVTGPAGVYCASCYFGYGHEEVTDANTP